MFFHGVLKMFVEKTNYPSRILASNNVLTLKLCVVHASTMHNTGITDASHKSSYVGAWYLH